MPKIHHALAAGALCLCSFTGTARIVEMNIDQMFDRLSVGNADIRAFQNRISAAEKQVDVARADRLPQINVSLTLNYIGNGTILDRNFSHAMEDKLPHFGNELNLSLYQPVFTGGAISASIELAHLNALLQSHSLDELQNGLRFELVQNYLNICKMNNLRNVYEENIQLTRQLIDQMRAKVENGTALANDITRYELRLSSLQYDLLVIENNKSVCNNNIILILGLDSDVDILPETPDFSDPLPSRTEEEWLELGMQNSARLKSNQTLQQMSDTKLKLARSERLPKVGIIAGDNLAGPVTFEIPAINKNYNAWYVGVNLAYDVSSLFKTSKKENQIKAEGFTTKLESETIAESLKRETHQAYIAHIQANQMLMTENINVKLARENYEIVSTRFQQNMALLTDMLDASTALLDSQVRQQNALINVLSSFYQLKLISSTI